MRYWDGFLASIRHCCLHQVWILWAGLDANHCHLIKLVVLPLFEPAKDPFWADSWRCDCAANIKPKKQNLERLFCSLQALSLKASKELQPERHQSKELSISLETFVSGFRLFSSNRELFYDFYGWNLESKVIQQVSHTTKKKRTQQPGA